MGRRSLVETIVGERGSGTFLAFATLLLVVGAATPLIFSANQAFEAERLDTAAELAALSAADSLSGFRTGHPCEVAAKVARLNSSKLVSCTLTESQVHVELISFGIRQSAKASS